MSEREYGEIALFATLLCCVAEAGKHRAQVLVPDADKDTHDTPVNLVMVNANVRRRRVSSVAALKTVEQMIPGARVAPPATLDDVPFADPVERAKTRVAHAIQGVLRARAKQVRLLGETILVHYSVCSETVVLPKPRAHWNSKLIFSKTDVGKTDGLSRYAPRARSVAPAHVRHALRRPRLGYSPAVPDPRDFRR